MELRKLEIVLKQAALQFSAFPVTTCVDITVYQYGKYFIFRITGMNLVLSVLATHSQKRTSCIKSAAGLLPCCHPDDIRMRSHCLLRLDDNKSAASCLA